MNISQVITALILDHGLYNITLPFKDPVTGQPKSAENVIQEVISNVTIPMYSQFVPWIRTGDCQLGNLKCVDKRRGIYKLPAYLCLTPVMWINDVSLPFHNSRGTYGDIAPAYGINRSVQGVITSQEYMMLAGQMRAEPTWEPVKEMKDCVRLYGFPNTMLTFEVACQHEANGETIEDSCYDSFMELATLDLEVFLWNNLKNYKELPSAHGTVNLNIDDYQNARSDRTQLLEKWRDIYHVDMNWEKFM